MKQSNISGWTTPSISRFGQILGQLELAPLPLSDFLLPLDDERVQLANVAREPPQEAAPKKANKKEKSAPAKDYVTYHGDLR
jgi:hypothetical protein